MRLSHLSLTNFRNFPQLELDLPPGVVIIYGRNAEGKTTLLEAMYLLAIARSSRAENDIQLVNWDAAAEGQDTIVSGTVDRQDERLRVHIGYHSVPPSPASSPRSDRPRVRKEIRVSRVRRTASELLGLVNAVLFTADDIQLVNGPPSIRRRYLDILLSQTQPVYLRSLQRYQRVVQQRNRLLRALQEHRAEEKELAFWDQELVKVGATIVEARHHAMAALSTLCGERHRDLVDGGEDLAVEYRPNVPLETGSPTVEDVERALTSAVEGSTRKDMAVSSTTVGPHRDDFRMSLGSVDMGTYASRGQARTVALALRLAEAAYLDSARGEAPIILLDDVLSELDAPRRSRVLERVTRYEQVIVTMTEPPTEGTMGEVWRPEAGSPVVSFFELESGAVVPVPATGPELEHPG